MSKNDKLLKRIEFYEKMASSEKPDSNELLDKVSFYERLALYSDRGSFLKALAQTPAQPLSNEVRQQIDSAMKDLSMTKPDDPKSKQLVNQLMNFYQGTNTDMGQLIQTLREAANTIPGNNMTQVQRVLDFASSLEQKQQQASAPADETVYMPEDKIKGLRPINKEQQSALGKFVTVNGLVFVDPMKMNDGQLGRETRKALDAFKKWYNEKATGKKITSDDEALQFAKYIVDNSPEKYGQ